jgi:hypothetical protein
MPKILNVGLNASDSANFRDIALSSLFDNILDNGIFTHYNSELTSSESQFGLEAKYSADNCTMILKEVNCYLLCEESKICVLTPLKWLTGYVMENY